MLPYLFYDTAIPHSLLFNNRPYRNASDLLVSTCPAVIDTLKLCGAESRIIDGDCSDYERFTALCYAMPYLNGHRVKTGIERILSALNVYDELSPYSVEDLWCAINDIIDEECLTPASLLTQMNVESVSCRVSPFDAVEKPDTELDLYAVCDLESISDLVFSKQNTANDLNSFISSVTEDKNYSAYKITLPKSYKYVRNSKRAELESIYTSLKNGVEIQADDVNALITYIFVSVSKALSKIQIPLILNANCDCESLDMLYSYLSLNAIYPSATVLNCPNPLQFEEFMKAHTVRTPIGMPSITPVGCDTERLFSFFPAGFTLQDQNYVKDLVTLAAATVDADRQNDLYGDDVAEAIVYGNVKNIFHI